MHELIKTDKGYVSNEAINASYDYTSAEIDLMVNIIQAIKPEKNNNTFSVIKLKIGQLIEHLNEDSRSAYDTIRRAIIGLQRKPYEIYYKDTKKYFVANFISSAEIDRYTGEVVITMHPKIRQIVSDITEQYTSFEIGSILRLKGKYSKRLYLLLNQFKHTGVRWIDLQDIRTNFKVGEKYRHYKEFKRRVLDPAIFEINEKTELTTNYSENKNFRKVEQFELSVKFKKDIVEVVGHTNQKAFMQKCGLSDWQITNILMTLQPPVINQILYNLQTNGAKIQNKGGYLNTVFIAHGVVMDRKLPRQINLIDQINETTTARNNA